MFEIKIGIDLGTSNILIYIDKKGIVINEPTVIAIESKTKKIIAVGKDAREMLGREPGNIEVIRPMSHGVISDYTMTEAIIKYYIKQAKGNFKQRIHVTIGIPSGVSEVERRSFEDAAYSAGAHKVKLLEEPIAGAIGASVNVAEAYGRMVVDIGGGTTDVAVLSLGGIVNCKSLKIAGNDFDQAIISHVRRENNVIIGDTSAEDIKIKIGSVLPRKENISMTFTGRDLVTGLPKKVTLSALDTIAIFDDIINRIMDTIYSVLEQTPPDLASDIYEGGILLTGGGSLIYGLGELIEQRLGVFTVSPENPLASVVKGLKESL